MFRRLMSGVKTSMRSLVGRTVQEQKTDEYVCFRELPKLIGVDLAKDEFSRSVLAEKVHPKEPTLAEQASEAFSQEHYYNAELLLKKAIYQEPNNSSLHYNLGLSYEKQHAFNCAIQEFELAYKLDPKFKEAQEARQRTIITGMEYCAWSEESIQTISLEPKVTLYRDPAKRFNENSDLNIIKNSYSWSPVISTDVQPGDLVQALTFDTIVNAITLHQLWKIGEFGYVGRDLNGRALVHVQKIVVDYVERDKTTKDVGTTASPILPFDGSSKPKNTVTLYRSYKGFKPDHDVADMLIGQGFGTWKVTSYANVKQGDVILACYNDPIKRELWYIGAKGYLGKNANGVDSWEVDRSIDNLVDYFKETKLESTSIRINKFKVGDRIENIKLFINNSPLAEKELADGKKVGYRWRDKDWNSVMPGELLLAWVHDPSYKTLGSLNEIWKIGSQGYLGLDAAGNHQVHVEKVVATGTYST